ncbi:MAG: UDP-N-acetylmuramate--L-alanine ligase [Flavobacteriales bacterium]|jgi:UDP-N-acetylmuramate--alanine ligase|nr:UDP-N-acetylmuramate--L-alanine ligase [Flavobacteriales bacterium]
MNIKSFKYIYLIGIGGIGMSALARYFYSQDKIVYGYDRVKSDLTVDLEDEGIEITYADNINAIPNAFNINESSNQLVIYSSAISNNSIYSYFSDNSFNMCKRAEALGLISEHYYTIAVAGTHGKTTTSIMLAHILKNTNVDCTAFFGGISKNYDTNFLLSNDSNYLVVEADEYDYSFLNLNPNIAIITSLDLDHLDIYEDHDDLISSFKQFASQVKDDGCLIIEESIAEYFTSPKNGKLFTYSHSDKSDYYADCIKQKINITNFNFNSNFNTSEECSSKASILLSMPGLHNISNALAAITASSYLNIDNNSITNSFKSFYGIKRRFDTHIISDKHVYIDDYAHHPNEISVTIETVKKLFPSRIVTVVFQPHLYSRTNDFAIDFANSLSLADHLIIMDIYAAREQPIKGVNSDMLLDLCSNKSKITSTKSSIISLLEEKDLDVLLTLGAGDISSLVRPIKEMMK